MYRITINHGRKIYTVWIEELDYLEFKPLSLLAPTRTSLFRQNCKLFHFPLISFSSSWIIHWNFIIHNSSRLLHLDLASFVSYHLSPLNTSYCVFLLVNIFQSLIVCGPNYFTSIQHGHNRMEIFAIFSLCITYKTLLVTIKTDPPWRYWVQRALLCFWFVMVCYGRH